MLLPLRLILLSVIFYEAILDDNKRIAVKVADCYRLCIQNFKIKPRAIKSVAEFANHTENYSEKNDSINEQYCTFMCSVDRNRPYGSLNLERKENDIHSFYHEPFFTTGIVNLKRKLGNKEVVRKKRFMDWQFLQPPGIPDLNYMQVDPGECPECKPGVLCKDIPDSCLCECLVHSRYPSVSVGLQNNTTNGKCRQKLYFKCTSDEIIHAATYALFKFYWYVDGVEAYVSKVENNTNLEKTHLTEFNGFSKLNVKVSCKYSSHKSPEDDGNISPTSSEFFAGIKTLNAPITVERDKTTAIQLHITVPIGSDCSTRHGTLTVEMKTPESAHCDGIKGFNKCGLTIERTEWNKTHSIIVKHTSDGRYELPQAPLRRVQLRTLSLPTHPIWSNLILPEISIHIVDNLQQWKGKVCSSHSDPHMMTFDGIKYDNQNPGTFIMYESKDGMGNIMQVQTKLTGCNKRYRPGIMCNCAVAVRAAADVYVINRCPGEEFFGFKHCVDNVLDVRKEDEFNYIIYFPTGTHVHLYVWKFQTEMVIEVDIFPSLFDEGTSKGLCSTLGTKGRFFEPDGTLYTNIHKPDAFSNMWLVPQKENLIEMSNFENLNRMKGLLSVCTCKRSESGDFADGALIECGMESQCHRLNTPVKNKCIQRVKRSMKNIFSFVPRLSTKNEKKARQKRSSVPVISEGEISQERAQSFCEGYFNSSRAFKACQQLPVLQAEKAIADCVTDIQLTNTTAWASAALEGFKTHCMKEVRQNNTLQAARDGNVSFAAKIKSVMCKNECSGHGVCENGTCLCDENFGAGDCSEDMRVPPSVYAVNSDQGGLCDDADCLEVNVEGETFLDGIDLVCKLTRFQASQRNMKVFFESTTTFAKHNTFMDIHCAIPVDRRNKTTFSSADRFVSGYMVSVSNNGRHFGSGSPIYILDSTCQDTVNTDGQLGFVLRENFCLIQGRCILNGTEEGLYNCSVCNAKLDAFDWTTQSERTECRRSGIPNGPGRLILLLCITVVALLCILIIIILVVKLKLKWRVAVADVVGPPPPYSDTPKPRFPLHSKQ